ncbi:hypothetical protein ACOA15_004696 [Klebsiella oxytoca]
MQRIVKAVPLLCFLLLGCDPAEKEAPRGSGKSSYVAANLLGYNHMAGTNINWFSVNGYRGHAGGGYLLYIAAGKMAAQYAGGSGVGGGS